VILGSIIGMREEMHKKKECETEKNSSKNIENSGSNKDDETNKDNIDKIEHGI